MEDIIDLRSGSIPRHLMRLALSIMGSSFVQMAYSFTDMAWLGRLGSEALASVGVVSVFVWIATSISLLSKTGTEITLSQSYGAGNTWEAGEYARHNAWLAMGLGGAVTLCYALGAGSLIDLYSLTPPVRTQALVYMYITLMGYPAIFLTSMLTGYCNARGQSGRAFRYQAVGLGCNMLLDPLLIHGLHLGVAGAAWATLVSQWLVVLLLFGYVRGEARDWTMRGALCWRYFAKILRIGLPVALLNVLFALVSIYMGRLASLVGGAVGVATLTTGGQLEALTWNTSQGITTALGIIVGQNWSAGRLDRVWSSYRYALTATLSIGALGAVFFFCGGSWLFSLIVPEMQAAAEGGRYLEISAYSQMLMMLEITTQGLLYGMGHSALPAGVSIAGNLLRIPLALLFISWGWGLSGVWWAISSSSILKGLLLFVLMLLVPVRPPRMSA